MARFARAMRGPAPAPLRRRKNPCPASPARKHADPVRVGVWRMAGADSRMRPPDHWHAAPVEGVQSSVGMPPKDAVCATRPNRQRGGGDAFAAPLRAVRLRPVRDRFGAVRRLPRVRRHRPSFSLLLCQKAQPAQFGGGPDGPITDLPFVQTCRASTLPLAEPQSKSRSRLRLRGPRRHKRGRCRSALRFRLLQLYAPQPRLALGSRTRRQFVAAIGVPRCNGRYSLSYSPPAIGLVLASRPTSTLPPLTTGWRSASTGQRRPALNAKGGPFRNRPQAYSP